MKTIDVLHEKIKLKKTGDSQFEGENFFTPWGRVYGGQVLAQALYAAYQTVPADRNCHSLHSYFILGGDLSLPVQYEVDIIRDGGSFTTRRVIAKQKNKPIFILAASFQIDEKGLSHQEILPNFSPPNKEEVLAYFNKETMDRMDGNAILKGMELDQIFQFLPVERTMLDSGLSQIQFWTQSESWETFSTPEKHQLLAFISDFGIMAAMSVPHMKELEKKKMMMASLDHALWFHRPVTVSQGVLTRLQSPSTSNARGFTRGNIYDAQGNLMVSVAQEGLFRIYES